MPSGKDLCDLQAAFQLAQEVGVVLGRSQILFPALPGHAASQCLKDLKSAVRPTGLRTSW